MDEQAGANNIYAVDKAVSYILSQPDGMSSQSIHRFEVID